MTKYGYPPQQKVGWLLGKSRGQVASVGVAVLVFLICYRKSPIVGGVLGVLIVAVGFGQWGGVPLFDRMVTEWRWLLSGLMGHRRWAQPVGGPKASDSPTCLRGVQITVADPKGQWAVGAPVGLVKSDGEYTGIMRVEGGQMALLSEADADRRVGVWGDLLASLCGERGERGLSRIAWCDVHEAASAKEHHAYLLANGRGGPASTEYSGHIDTVTRSASRHSVYVAITVSGAIAKRHTSLSGKRRRLDASVAVLDEITAISRDLLSRGFEVDRPLSPLAVVELVRHLSDPYAVPLTPSEMSRRMSMPVTGEFGPVVVDSDHRRYVAVDGAVHRSYEFRWPSRPVPADWMRALLVAGGGPKLTTMVYQPVAPSKSNQRISHRLGQLSTNTELEAKRKHRVSAVTSRQRKAAEAHESELAAGHGEHEVFCLVTVAGRDEDDLDARCDKVERAAARIAGARLRPLDVQHDQGWAASLPLGLKVGRPKG